MARGRQLFWASAAAAMAMTCSLSLAAIPANASVTIGETFTPTNNCGAGVNSFMITSPAPPAAQYTVPTAGVITSWSYRTAADPPELMRFKAFRPSGPPNFQTVGRSSLETPAASALNTYSTRVPVQAGDLIGFYAAETDNNYPCVRVAAGFADAYHAGADTTIGSIDSYTTDMNFQVPLAAVLEPDADGDGYGDETQDACPTDPLLQVAGCDAGGGNGAGGDRTAPETTLGSKPKKKTTKRKAVFTFTGSEAGATFKCSVDGAPFAPCTSPRAFKTKSGRHTFVVLAKDNAGNADDSPATYSWTVKRR